MKGKIIDWIRMILVLIVAVCVVALIAVREAGMESAKGVLGAVLGFSVLAYLILRLAILKCPHCGKKLKQGVGRTCPYCGKQM